MNEAEQKEGAMPRDIHELAIRIREVGLSKMTDEEAYGAIEQLIDDYDPKNDEP